MNESSLKIKFIREHGICTETSYSEWLEKELNKANEVLSDIANGTKNCMLKKDGTVFLQSAFSRESYNFLATKIK